MTPCLITQGSESSSEVSDAGWGATDVQSGPPFRPTSFGCSPLARGPLASVSTAAPTSRSTSCDRRSMHEAHTCGYLVAVNAADKLLRIYVNDHRAGAVAGVSLCRRMSEQDGGTSLSDLAAELLIELESDRDELEHYAVSNGIAADPFKRFGAAIAERVARLKPNGRIIRRSPLSDVLETEALMIAIDAKRALWQSLVAGDRIAPFDVERLEQLMQRAGSQLVRLEVEHRRAARTALAAADRPL